MAAWLADTVRAIRGKERRDASGLPRTMNAPRANRLGAKLWGGFSGPAAADLETLCRSSELPKMERRAAAWHLAEWHHFKHDARAALSWLEFTERLDARWRLDKPNLLLQSGKHLELGNFSEADRLIAEGVERYGYDTDLCLLSSNALAAKAAKNGDAAEADEARLEFINRIYAAAKLRPIRKIDRDRPLRLDNITSAAPGTPRTGAGVPMISVIVPAHNAEKTIGFVLSGLLEQSWRNIEIIVVDDCSSDSTRAIVEGVATTDPRVKLVRSERNAGPYVARNLGVRHARGEFVTVHDSDDWSHSQKLAVQIDALLASDAIANMSAWVRLTMDLQVNHLWRARSRFAHANHSSLLLRRDTVKDLGGWDPVRFHADNEFVQRTIRKYGVKRVHWIKHIPLSFGLMRAESLTRSEASHIGSLTFGARMEYRRAFDRWHARAFRRGDFRLNPAPAAPRKFPAPASMLVGKPGNETYDVIFAGDLALPCRALAPLHAAISQLLEDGCRVGVFHWPRYELDIDRELDATVARLIDEFSIGMIAADQSATADDLVFFDPAGLRHKIDRVPTIAYKNLYVVGMEAGRPQAGGGPAFDPLAASKNLEDLVGSSGEWIAGFLPRRRSSGLQDGAGR